MCAARVQHQEYELCTPPQKPQVERQSTRDLLLVQQPVKPGFKLCQAHYNRQVEILNRARSSSAVKESVAVLWKMIKMPQRH